VVQEGAEGVGPLQPLGADPLLRPLPVVDGVVRLHGRNHAEARVAREVLRRDVLRVLDARPPVARTVGCSDVLEQIQHHRDGPVADRVDAELLARAVDLPKARAHALERLHLVGQQAAALRVVGVGFEEQRRGGPEGAIGKPLGPADADEGTLSGRFAGAALLELLREGDLGGHRPDPRRQLVARVELPVQIHVLVGRPHVLHGGDAERGHVSERPAQDPLAALGRVGGNHALHQRHGGVFQHAGRLAGSVADDQAAGRVGRPSCDARHLQRERVRERHVFVVPVDEHGRVARDPVDHLPRGQRRAGPLLFVPVAAEDPLAGGRSPRAVANPA